ncbi:unnamed protein product [Cladocopium goreaui]|uniref:Pentatricopeptide repeat-containing protein GUN1, chloroplastic (Pentatricopeptide repeat-containing protein At2g31400) (Protein GENOMES UNCOUPLED 1) n=1 Tax=Cladocopium goreaui TaxID=2562237 RepID=A0A9P1C3K0_9DINO|nr:unnamed protein product [Cladocopium goreaui]
MQDQTALKQQLEELEEQQKQIQSGLKEALQHHRRLWANELQRCQETSKELEKALEDERQKHKEQIKEWERRLQSELTKKESQWREEDPCMGGRKGTRQRQSKGQEDGDGSSQNCSQAKGEAQGRCFIIQVPWLEYHRDAAPKRRAAAPAAPAGKLRRTGSSDDVTKAPAARGKKGGAKGKKVDENVPGAGSFKVYEDYAVKLNQTDVKGNNNKTQSFGTGFAALMPPWNIAPGSRVAIKSRNEEIILRNQAVSAAVRAQNWPKALRILQEAREESLQLTLVSYNSGISAVRRWRSALEADVISSNSTMDSLQRSAAWELALALLLNREANEISRNSAMSVLEKCAQWRKAVQLFGEDTASVIGFNALISSCEKAGCWPAALATLMEMEMGRVQRDEISFSSVLTSFEKGTKWARLCWLLEELQEKIVADVIIYNTAISAAEKISNWQMALAFLQEIGEASLQMDTISLNAAISACEKAAEWHRALQLFEMSHQIELPPSAVTFAAILSALEKAPAWRLALHTLRSATRRRAASIVACSAGIAACGKGQRWPEAVGILKDLKVHGLRANLVSFNSTLTACELASRWRCSVLLLEELHLQLFESQLISINCVLSALARAGTEKLGAWCGAVGLLVASQRAMTTDVLSYKEVIEACASQRPAVITPWLLDSLASSLMKTVAAVSFHGAQVK